MCRNCKYCIKEYWKYEFECIKGSEIRICQQEDAKRDKKLTILGISSILLVITIFILINPAILLIEGNPDKLRSDIINYIYDYSDSSDLMSYDSLSYTFIRDKLEVDMSFTYVIQQAGSPNVYLEDKKYIVGLWCIDGGGGIIITFKDKAVIEWEFIRETPYGRSNW